MENFHFLQPLWLFALFPLLLLLVLLQRLKQQSSSWHKVIDANLLRYLLSDTQHTTTQGWLWLLAAGWFIAVIALANPTWEKQPQPVKQTDSSRVIVLDLSRSMQIADLKPSRLSRARFKIEDILSKKSEGQVALVVFAGDAFVVTPLTRDKQTIRSMLPALVPSIMPVQGSRVDLGLQKALELLQQAGVAHGQVLLIADGAERESAMAAAEQLKAQGHELSVLAVGTEIGGPIPRVRNAEGKPIVVALQADILQAIADVGGGRYTVLRGDAADISYLLLDKKGEASAAQKQDDAEFQQWKAQGPMVALLLLPLAALAFRKGYILLLMLVVLQPYDSYAFGWNDLWQRQDQQADKALRHGDFDQAQELAVTPMQKGSVAYKQANYEQALEQFSKADSADAHYNKANALAQLQKYEEAIEEYDKAVVLRPDMDDAINNKKQIEDLLKQQEEQQNKDNQKQQDGQQGEYGKEDKGEQKDQDNKGSQNGEQNKDGQESQDNKDGQQGKDGQQVQDEQNAKDGQQDADKNNQFDQANKAAQKGDSDDEKTQAQTGGDEAEEQAKDKLKDLSAKNASEKANEQQDSDGQAAAILANDLSDEEKMAAEQWLRRIPDDPAGLLRRKFKYQYQRQDRKRGTGGQVPW